MTFNSLTRNATRAAIPCALSLSLTLTLSTSAYARASSAQTQDAKAEAQENHFERGKRLLEEGHADEAIAELKPVAEGRKKDADAWYLLGVALNRSGRNKDARKAFEKAIKLRPGDGSAHAGRAYALFLLGKFSDADKEARLAVATDANNADAHFVLSVLLFNAEKFVEAEAEAQTALRLKPDYVAATRLAADALLSAFIDERVRQASLYPMSKEMSDEERKAVYAKREPAYEQMRARLRALADRLEAIAASNPGGPVADGLREQAESLRFYEHDEGPAVGMRNNEVTTKAVITSKPEPGFTQEAREHNTQGRVRLRAVLGADGRVLHIVVLKGLPHGLNERCIQAARQIRFKPATLDGKPVSQFVVLEYNFHIY